MKMTRTQIGARKRQHAATFSASLRSMERILFTSFFSPAGFYDVPRVLITVRLSPPPWAD